MCSLSGNTRARSHCWSRGWWALAKFLCGLGTLRGCGEARCSGWERWSYSGLVARRSRSSRAYRHEDWCCRRPITKYQMPRTNRCGLEILPYTTKIDPERLAGDREYEVALVIFIVWAKVALLPTIVGERGTPIFQLNGDSPVIIIRGKA